MWVLFQRGFQGKEPLPPWLLTAQESFQAGYSRINIPFYTLFLFNSLFKGNRISFPGFLPQLFQCAQDAIQFSFTFR